jgi:hypothetical protein
MTTQYLPRWLPATLTACLFLTSNAHAETTPVPETTPNRDELLKLIEGALPDVIKEDNSKLVDTLKNVRLGTPLSKSFNPTAASAKLFGRTKTKLSANCLKLVTATGDLDRRDCTISVGSEKGRGAYSQLEFRKNLSLGDIRFLKRRADGPVNLKNLKPVTLADGDAYKSALDFLTSTFGLDTAEIPTPPADAKNPFPVKNIRMGWTGESGRTQSIPVEKMVSLKRGFQVSFDGTNLAGPIGYGEAVVVLDDAGVQQAIVKNWQDVLPHPRLEASRAKSRSTLVQEIADDLSAVSQGPVASMKTRLMLASLPQDNGVGYLLPAVQLTVAPQARDLSEEQQAQVVSSAGFVREYYLAYPGEDNEGTRKGD